MKIIHLKGPLVNVQLEKRTRGYLFVVILSYIIIKKIEKIMVINRDFIKRWDKEIIPIMYNEAVCKGRSDIKCSLRSKKRHRRIDKNHKNRITKIFTNKKK